tara:strand:+ start:7498 stop:8460 length:963 start_codon:yes stop_codon:yes gene_type:complete
VTAYDDVVGIETPCLSEFGDLGLKGSLLINFLAASRGKDVIFEEPTEDAVELKCGRARLKVPTLSSEDFVFEMPRDSAKELAVSDESFVEALRRCELSMGLDPGHPWRMGVTIEVTAKDEVAMYSSNNVAITRSTAQVKAGKKQAKDVMVVPPRWVELVSQLARQEGLTKIIYDDSEEAGWIVACFGKATRLFARLVAQGDVEKFKTSLDYALPEDASTYDIPKGFQGVLDRALVVLETAPDKAITIKVAAGKMRFSAGTAAADYKDFCKSADHPEATIICSPALLKKAVEVSGQIRIVSDVCVQMSGPRFDHVVSAIDG